MSYKVKWVEDNLGVTRNQLRRLERAGLMPENKDKQDRDYNDEDIDRIWTIKVLQGMGYTFKEIVHMDNDEQFNFDNSITQKISELEQEKKKIERHLGYAKTIKLTGRFPLRPKQMGEMKVKELQENALEGWNIVDDTQGLEYAKLADTVLSKSPEDWDNSDLARMISSFESITTLGVDVCLVEHVLIKEIVKRKHLGADHSDIQFMLKLIYENIDALGSECEVKKNMTVKQFSRYYSSSYLVGDIAKVHSRDYSQEEREFIAEVVAIFGGYRNYKELIEEELKYGR